MQNMIRLTAVFILLAVLLRCSTAEQVSTSKPREKVRIVCFNGKLDSGSSCTTTNFQKDGAIHAKGKMKCGFPGHASEIEWVFIGQKDSRDVYRFTRRYPLDTNNVVTTTKDVEVKSRRVIVFEDDKQAIVLEPPGE